MPARSLAASRRWRSDTKWRCASPRRRRRSKPRIRFAVLGNEPMVHPERFGEIVATNRGAVMRVFTDEALALEWLLGKNRES